MTLEGWFPTRLTVDTGASILTDHVTADMYLGDMQSRYAEAVRAAMQDMLDAVRDPSHQLSVSGVEGRAALAMARQATDAALPQIL